VPSPSLAGDYAIVSYTLQGTPIRVSGGMRLSPLAHDRYHFETAVTNLDLRVTLRYRGLLQDQGIAAAITPLATNDPSAIVNTPILTDYRFDGSSLTTRNGYGQAAVWIRR